MPIDRTETFVPDSASIAYRRSLASGDSRRGNARPERVKGLVLLARLRISPRG